MTTLFDQVRAANLTVTSTVSALLRVDSNGTLATTTLQANFSLSGGTLSLASALVSVNSITAASGTNLSLAGGTAGSSSVLVTNTTASTSTTTGALVVSGGLGIAGATYIGGLTEVAATIRSRTANGTQAQVELIQTGWATWALRSVASSSNFVIRANDTTDVLTLGTSGSVTASTLIQAPTVTARTTTDTAAILGFYNAGSNTGARVIGRINYTTAAGVANKEVMEVYVNTSFDDQTDLRFYTNAGTNAVRLTLNSTAATFAPTIVANAASNALRITSSQTPASASATGTTGTVCWDSSYVYVCTGTNTWKRAALSTW